MYMRIDTVYVHHCKSALHIQSYADICISLICRENPINIMISMVCCVYCLKDMRLLLICKVCIPLKVSRSRTIPMYIFTTDK